MPSVFLPVVCTHLDVSQLYAVAVETSAIHSSGMALPIGDWSIDNQRGPVIPIGVSNGAYLLVLGEEDDGSGDDVLRFGAQRKDIARSRGIQQGVETVRERVHGVRGFAIVSRVQLVGIISALLMSNK